MALNKRTLEVSSEAGVGNKRMKARARRSHGLSEDVLLLEVLTWLPAKSLCRFKIVSRLWVDKISGDRFFALRQSRRQTCISSGLVYSRPRHGGLGFFPTCGPSVGVPDASLGFPEAKKVQIIACVHGLLLLHVHLTCDQFLYICNPATGEGMRIPGGMRGRNSNFGLAFDPWASPDRYMVINAQRSTNKFTFETFSSNTGRWTASSAKPVEFSTPFALTNVVFAGGVVYWHLGNNILSYDTIEDAAQVIWVPLVVSSSRGRNWFCEIGVWEERLTCTRSVGDTMRVWVMRKKKSEWEWELRVQIPMDRVYSLRPSLFPKIWCLLYLVPIPYEGGNNFFMRIKVNAEEGEGEGEGDAKEVIVKWDMEAEEAAVLGEIEAFWSESPASFSYPNSLIALPHLPNMK